MQLEERLRAHYSVVLEHMEAQLKMALRLQVNSGDCAYCETSRHIPVSSALLLSWKS
jgi:hypothetical protein